MSQFLHIKNKTDEGQLKHVHINMDKVVFAIIHEDSVGFSFGKDAESLGFSTDNVMDGDIQSVIKDTKSALEQLKVKQA